MNYRSLFFLVGIFSAVYAKNTTVDCPSLDSILLPECGMTKLVTKIKADTCVIRKRLIPFIDYLKEKERPCSTITADVLKRYAFIHDTVTFKINTDHIQWLGDTSAPVSLIIYVSMFCPHCKQVYFQLCDSLQKNGSLRKSVKIGLKNLSVTKYDHMLVAAAQLGKQPRFMLTFARISERVSDESMQRVADSIGISYDSLEKLADSVTIARIVNSSREEALRNGVTGTPAIFINNKRYQSSKDIRWILEAVASIAAKKNHDR